MGLRGYLFIKWTLGLLGWLFQALWWVEMLCDMMKWSLHYVTAAVGLRTSDGQRRVQQIDTNFPANMRHLSNDGLMLRQRRRRWPNIKPALDKCHMFAGIGSPHHMIHWEMIVTKKLFRFALTTMLCKDNAKAKKAVAVYLSSKQTLFFGLARQTTYPRDALQSARNQVLLVKLDTLGIINNSGIFISMLVSKTFFVLTKCFNK